MVKKNKVQLRFLYYFETVLKRLAFNSSTIMSYVMRTKNIKFRILKAFHSTPENTVKSHPCLLKYWLHKYNVLLFTLYIWNQPLRIKFSDQLINEMLTALSICTKKIQSCRSTCLACLNFLIGLGFFMLFI